jgi:hypothetical protein
MMFFGCGGVMTIGLEDSAVDTKVSELKTKIIPGETTKTELNNTFDGPQISSDSWRLEVYSFVHNDIVSVWGWGIIPIPTFPAWADNLQERVYLLVVYDEQWKVKDFDTGYFVERLHEFRDHRSDDASAGGFTFDLPNTLHGWDKAYEWLIAPKHATTQILRIQPEPDSCSIFIITFGPDSRVYLDGDIIIDERGRRPKDSFLMIQVAPGDHEIEVTPHAGILVWGDYTGGTVQTIHCGPLERRYVVIKNSITTRPKFWQRYLLTSNIKVTDTPTPDFESGRAALYHNGKWFGPDKPE